MENKSEISVGLLISGKCEDFLTKADWIVPQLGFMGTIKEALLRQKKSLSSKHYFRHEQLIPNMIHLLLLNVQYHWQMLCRLSVPFIELLCAAGSGSATQLNFDQSRVKHQRSVCAAATPAAKRLTGRLDTSPSVTDTDQYQLGVRSEETDKGSESGRRRLIDWRQIHPLSTSLPLHESVKPPLSCT